jgi:drug/metabolite transporter (DMT)-like permease
LISVIEGILVAVIWASSFVFVKMGLIYMGPLTLAGLRYLLAASVLLPWLLRQRVEVARLPRSMWLRLALMGLCAYTIANGAFYWGLRYLPATTVSFLMSFNPLLILIASLLWLKEFPSRRQLIGLGITLAGGVVFFASSLDTDGKLGLAIVLLGLVAFSAFGVLGRDVARHGQVSTLVLTALPLAIGGASLLLVGLPLEGLPHMTATAWGLVLWLAVLNTAVAYVLYNHALKMLTALEMNVLLNLTPLVTALWAWFLLAERLTWVEGAGMLVALIGIGLVQQRPK